MIVLLLFQKIVEESSNFRRLVYRQSRNSNRYLFPGEMALSHSGFFPFLPERHFSHVEVIFRDPDFDAGVSFPFFFPPPCPELARPVERRRTRWRTLSALTFSIYLLFRSAILTAEMSRGECTECARSSEIEIVVLHFARLQHDAYYFNERCSLPSGYLIGRPARQRDGAIISNLSVSFSTLHEYFYLPQNSFTCKYFLK